MNNREYFTASFRARHGLEHLPPNDLRLLLVRKRQRGNTRHSHSVAKHRLYSSNHHQNHHHSLDSFDHDIDGYDYDNRDDGDDYESRARGQHSKRQPRHLYSASSTSLRNKQRIFVSKDTVSQRAKYSTTAPHKQICVVADVHEEGQLPLKTTEMHISNKIFNLSKTASSGQNASMRLARPSTPPSRRESPHDSRRRAGDESLMYPKSSSSISSTSSAAAAVTSASSAAPPPTFLYHGQVSDNHHHHHQHHMQMHQMPYQSQPAAMPVAVAPQSYVQSYMTVPPAHHHHHHHQQQQQPPVAAVGMPSTLPPPPTQQQAASVAAQVQPQQPLPPQSTAPTNLLVPPLPREYMSGSGLNANLSVGIAAQRASPQPFRISAAKGAAVRVSNLHRFTTIDDVRSAFSPYGPIRDFYLYPSASGYSSGVAMVLYPDRDCCQKAINALHNIFVDGLVLCVEHFEMDSDRDLN